jgi:predicted GIY-YIG superfamily endonuclease
MGERFQHVAPNNPELLKQLIQSVHDLTSDVTTLVRETEGGVDPSSRIILLRAKINLLADDLSRVTQALAERLAYREQAALRAAERDEKMRKTMLEHIVATGIQERFNPHGNFVYLLWPRIGNVPLYVGRSMNVLSRLGNHMGDQRKRTSTEEVQLLRCKTQAEMVRTELALIRKYNPPLNIAGVTRTKTADFTSVPVP